MLLKILVQVVLWQHISIGLGLLLIIMGFFLLPNSGGLRFSINSSRGILEIQNFSGFQKKTTAFPLDYFSQIIIQEHLQKKSRHKFLIRYEVFLETAASTYLLLADFPDKKQALAFVEKLSHILLLNVYYQQKLYTKAEFQVRTENVPEDITLSETSQLKKNQQEQSIVLTWKHTPGIFSWIAWFCSLTGIYYLLTYLIPGNTADYLVPIIVFILFLILAAFSLTNKSALYLGRESIRYKRSISGFELHFKSMNWDDVGKICNSIVSPRLLLFSLEMDEIIEEYLALLQTGTDIAGNVDLMTKLEFIKKEQLNLNVSCLSVSDRTRLEQEIMNFML